MNKIYILSILVSIIALSCSDTLDIDAAGTISGNVLTNDENIEQSLVGAYYSFSGINDGVSGGELFGGDFILIPTLLAHPQSLEIFWSSTQAPGYANFIDKDVITTNIRIADNWRRAYEVINTVNNILANIDAISDSQTQNRIQGEALAMRGMLYFEMVRLWAPQYNADGVDPSTDSAIPRLLEPITDVSQIATPTLATIDDVYDQAETDLTTASGLLLPFGKNGTRLSYYACQAYLARLSLQKGEYGDAFTYSNNVITSGEYTLMSDPLAAFNNSSNSTEDIFAIQQTLANNTGDRTSGSGITTFYSSLTESGLGIFGILQEALGSTFVLNTPKFSPSDRRGSIDATATTSTTSGDISTAFYTNTINTLLISPSKYLRTDHVLPIIRLAEMHLIRAEAIFETNGNNVEQSMLDDLNLLRSRAGTSTLQLSDFTADPIVFFDTLVLERSREFLYEGHLLHDLRRWRVFFNPSIDIYGIGNEFQNRDPWDPRFILPIPQAEIDTWTN